MIRVGLYQNMGKVLIALVIASVLILIVGLTTANNAGAKGAASCFGTYLIEFDNNQSVGIWSLSNVGTAHATDSAEQVFGFSHLQGSWKSKGDTANVTLLNITINPSATTPLGYGRVDAELTFGENCESTTGTYDVRLYGPLEDPLDRTIGTLVTDGAELEGRRINP